MSITWNNAPEKGDKITSLTITNDLGSHDTSGHWFQIDVTDFINLEEGSFSIMIENVGPVSADNGVYFAPVERGTEEIWSSLVIGGSLDIN